MKKSLKRLLSVILCMALCAGMCVHAVAANENNTRGVTFSATLDTLTIQTSTEAQTVVMTLTASEPVAVDGIGLKVTKDSPLTIASIAGGDEIEFTAETIADVATGIVGWSSPNYENVTDVTELLVVTFTVPANTPAGTYNVGVTNLELTENYGDIWENAATATASLTITDAPAAVDGYTAGISTLSNEVSVNDTVKINVAVDHSEDEYFAAGEIVLTYDSAKLTFNQTASSLGDATVSANAGTLTLEDYGTDKTFGTGVYVLAFDAIADGEAEVTLTSAAFVNMEDAEGSDLIPATITSESKSVTLTISEATEPHTVTLPNTNIFTGPATVEDGASYTFSVADGDNYDYDTITATMGGVDVTVIDNGDGTYTIENVTGALVITGTRTEKSYGVTFEGTAAEDITDGAANATYATDYTFTMPTADGYAYSLDSITIGGTAYTGYTVANSVYTIPGSAITGAIVITVNKSATEVAVTVEGTGAGAAAGYSAAATKGQPYTLTITPESGYTYTVTATMDDVTATVVDNGNNTYTIANVTGNIKFTVVRAVATDGVTVSENEYLPLDGTNMWLVTNKIEVAEGKVPTYDGEKMFWSEKYEAYCYLVIAETLSTEAAKAKVGIAEGTVVAVNYGMDVNMTGKVDASDAQLTYNMYNVMYSDFTEVSMEKFLRADVNGDSVINTQDAAAIIAAILDK